MQLSSDLVLDDILNRSIRLESPMNFRIPLDFENILEHSRNILVKYKDDADARDSGKLLLAGQKVNDESIDINKATKALESIDSSTIVLNEKLSFSEKCSKALKTSISESIDKSSKKDDIASDDFIFSNIALQMKEKETLIHRYLCHPEPVSISQETTEKMELNSIANFYKSNLFTTDFVHKIEKSVRNYLSQDVQNSLADTFLLIDCLSQDKSPTGSINYLKHLFRRVITNEVNKNRINSNRGGKIGLIPTIKAYVNLQNYSFEYTPWAVIYYALLCDVQDELYEFLILNGQDFSNSIKPALEQFFNHLPLTKAIADALEKYLSRDVTMSKKDPFKTIVLAILTRKHDIPDSEKMIRSIEEWLWIRMQFIYEDSLNGEFSSGLVKLQNELRNFEPKERSNPFLKGQLYLLIQLYQEAAEWFLSCEDYIDHCLHIVISMNMADLIDDHILVKPLLIYAKEVFLSDPAAAIQYLSLLHEKELRVNSIVKLIVEVNNGENAFQSLQNDLPDISKVILADEQHEVIQKAAELAEYRGMHGKAARIFWLNDRKSRAIDQNDKIIDLECTELRKYIQDFLDDSVLEKASVIYKEMLANNSKVSLEKLEALRVLLRFAHASCYAKKGDFRKAADEIERAEFLPAVPEQVLHFREAIMANEHLRKALPEMIIIAVSSYANLYMKGAEGGGVNKAQMMAKDKEKADAILELTSDIDIPNYAQKQLLDYSLKFQ